MADKIEFTIDKNQITALWSSVFGDSEQDIAFFLDNCRHKKCLGYFADNKLVSMIFIVDCTYCGMSGGYIYAVSTYNDFRGRGYASKLIETAKKYDYDFLWLIPAEDSLFDFYKRFDFKTKLYSDKKYDNCIAFDENDEICEYLYEGSAYKYPKGMVYSKQKFTEGGTGFKVKE